MQHCHGQTRVMSRHTWHMTLHTPDMTHSWVRAAATAWPKCNTVLHVLHLVNSKTVTATFRRTHPFHNIYVGGMAHSCMRHDSFTCVIRLIHLKHRVNNSLKRSAQEECNNFFNRANVHTGWQRCVRCLVFIDHFPPKSPIISGSFAKRDLQFKASYASSPPCTRASSCSGATTWKMSQCRLSTLLSFSATEPCNNRAVFL